MSSCRLKRLRWERRLPAGRPHLPGFCQEGPEDLLLLRVPDTGEHLLPELVDGLRLVEGESLIHLAAFEVAGLAAGLKDGADLGLEVDRRCACPEVRGLRGGGPDVRCSRPEKQSERENGRREQQE
jgi:hypothetical protein